MENDFIKPWKFYIYFALMAISLPVFAQYEISETDIYRKFLSDDISSKNAESFGEKVSLYSGSVEFDVADVSLPGNNDLPVEFRRRYRIEDRRESSSGNAPLGKGYFGGVGEWDVDVPYLRGVFLNGDRWHSDDNGLKSDLRCSYPWKPVSYGAISFHDYWDGNYIHIPGAGDEAMLAALSSSLRPTSGSYPWVTKSRWSFSCLPSTKNGYAGEGFVGISPSGVKYHFDWVAEKQASHVNSNGNRYDRNAVYFLATLVEDRFGNWVKYHYSGDKLLKIESSDGRLVDIYYSSQGVSRVEAGNRVWFYYYSSNNRLQKVVLPDGSSWGYSAEGRLFIEKPLKDDYNPSDNCTHSGPSLARRGSFKYFVSSPSGGQAKFIFIVRKHGRNNVPRICVGIPGTSPPTQDTYLRIPKFSHSYSLIEKEVDGVGLPHRAWRYIYQTTVARFKHECEASPCARTKRVQVLEPEGRLVSYDFGVLFRENDGLLLGQHFGTESNPFQSSITYSYIDPISSPQMTFPAYAGFDLSAFSDGVASSAFSPLSGKTISQGGVIYSSVVSSYDALARPLITINSNNLGFSRTDVAEYHDDFGLWVLGQSHRQYTLNSTPNGEMTSSAMLSSEVEYNAQALPWKTYTFGKLQQTITYHPDGTVATVTDGRGKATTLLNWKRGIPQLIQYPATPEAPSGSTESAVVDNNGWITSTTDENSFTHVYDYDNMGRLKYIVYPGGDNVAWLPKSFEFRAVTTSDWLPPGISVGQWRHYEGQGNYAKFTYFDAMWRPVLVQEYDTSNVAATIRYTRTTYDSNGRVSFQSYPVSDPATAITGVRTFYDALDRVVLTEQDSEQDVLSTTIEYLDGLQVRVTNPRDQKTTTGFMAWDQPNYDLPLWSSRPEGKVIEIARHPQFGWPLQLKQRSADSSLQASRQYVYDGNAQLCKSIEPETGASVMGYDAAGNLAWQVSGLPAASFNSTSDCQHLAAAGTGLALGRTYDNRNRLTHLTFPDGKGNQIWTYEKDNLPTSVTAYNGTGHTDPVVTAYTYNKRRLLTGESLSQPSYTWGIGYEYDTIGNLRWQSYPTGLKLDFAPNALGQATQARNANQSSIYYASGAQYFPNGALKEFTYGNGIVHTMSQNARQLPARVTSTGNVLDFGYDYDKNGNPTTILDLVTGTPTAQHRWMSYDGLDRLITSASAMYDGSDHTHRFTYDALDNIESWKHAGVKDYADYVYDAQNRLTSIRNTTGAAVVGIGYDSQGNLANKNGQLYEFDYGNRLRNVVSKESYRYDGLGRRVQTTKSDDSQTTLWQYGQAGQILFSTDWDGLNYLNQKTHEFVYLAGSLIATIDHAWPSNAVIATKYQHTDALGSPVAVTNEAGAVVERNNYEPYGAIIGNPTRSGIGYTGHVMDGATRLTYMQQRYYDQSLGRFLSVDPVTADSANGSNFNRYKYSENNPYRFKDPDGRQSLEQNSPSTSTGHRLWDWLMKPSDVKAASKGQMIEEQLVAEFSQEQSWKDVVLYVAIAMSAGTGGSRVRGGKSANTARQADDARDALGAAKGTKHATYTGGHKNGKVVAGCSSNPSGCGEDDVARQLGNDVQFTKSFGWRGSRSPETGKKQWKEIPVCTRCQGKYDRSQFPPDVKHEAGGPWDKK